MSRSTAIFHFLSNVLHLYTNTQQAQTLYRNLDSAKVYNTKAATIATNPAALQPAT